MSSVGGEEHLRSNVRTYKVLAVWFVLVGAIGILVGAYGLIIGQSVRQATYFSSYAFGFAMFGLILYRNVDLLIKMQCFAASSLQLSKAELRWVRDQGQIKVLSVFLVIAGLAGTGLALFFFLSREEVLYGRVQTFLYALYSVLFFSFGFVLFGVSKKLIVAAARLNGYGRITDR